MSKGDTALLVIDMQVKLMPAIADHQRVSWNARRLIDAAHCLGLPVVGTEQYPRGLGPTIATLADRLGERHEKTMFSCGECAEVFHALGTRGVHKILVAGVEAHVCVLQTVLDLMTEGFDLYVAADAVGSRFPLDAQWALKRMDSSGASITTTEAAMFEWCEVAGNAEFKQISALARESCPDTND